MKATAEADNLNPANADNATANFSINQIVSLVEHLPSAISITDLTGNIVYVNDAFATTTGYSKQEVIGKNHSIVSYKTTPSSIYQSLWKSISNGIRWQGHLVNKRKNGERYLAEVNILPIDNKSDSGGFYLGSHRDVSQNHSQHTELKNQNELFASVLNTVPSAVALLDENQNVVLDNLAYKTLASDFSQEPIKMVIDELKTQLELDAHEKVQASHFSENKTLTIVLQHTQQRHFRCRFLTLEMLEDQIDDFFRPKVSLHTVVVLQEFTREFNQTQKQRIAERRQNILQSEMLHAMQETMQGVVHQLQGPVNTIESALNMLAQLPEQSAAVEPLNMAFSASEKALHTLEKSLPERPQEARQSVNLNQIVHELSQIMADALLKNAIDLQLNLNGTLPAISAQPIRLTVALKKLFDNAVEAICQHQPTERVIKITTKIDDEMISLAIADSGPGIAKSQRIRVFEPFYSTKPEHSEGSRGIGLSIVQQIIAEHHASIHIQASEFGGCQISLLLPRH